MVNQRSRKPGLKAPPRVQELAARGEASDDDALAEVAAEADEGEDAEASETEGHAGEDAEASESEGHADEDAEASETEGHADADVSFVEAADEGLAGEDAEVSETELAGEDAEVSETELAREDAEVSETESVDADEGLADDDATATGDPLADAVARETEGLAAVVGTGSEGASAETANDELADAGAVVHEEVGAGVVSPLLAAEVDVDAMAGDAATDTARAGGEVDGAASDADAMDPLADMLAEFDAPRPVAPGVQLSEEIPIDPEDDLRTVEGEASLRLVSILESLLFAAAKPLKVQDLRKVLAETTKHQIQLALKYLMAATAERGVVLAQVAGGFQFRTHPENAVWVQKMLQSKPARLSRTQIETLAIVAYRQPITRPEIDSVRGVDSGAVLKTLLERELIQIVGKKEEPGRPLLYGTTVRFLEFFNLRSLRDMPTLRDFRDLSEESKATLRARLGESEAEALGQGVLGLDLSAGPKARVEGTGAEEGAVEELADELGEDSEHGAEDSEHGAEDSDLAAEDSDLAAEDSDLAAEVDSRVDSQEVVEETAVEEAAVEEAAVEETVVEETVVEETAVEETVVEETAVEETAAEEAAVEETAVEETVVEETAVEETAVEETAVEETAVEETAVEEAAVVEEVAVDEAVVEEVAVEEPTAAADMLDPDAGATELSSGPEGDGEGEGESGLAEVVDDGSEALAREVNDAEDGASGDADDAGPGDVDTHADTSPAEPDDER